MFLQVSGAPWGVARNQRQPHWDTRTLGLGARAEANVGWGSDEFWEEAVSLVPDLGHSSGNPRMNGIVKGTEGGKTVKDGAAAIRWVLVGDHIVHGARAVGTSTAGQSLGALEAHRRNGGW